MNNKKGFIPVIIILVVLIGFVGVYYLGTLKSKSVDEDSTTASVVSPLPSSVSTSKSESTDTFANWKVYVNTSSNYQIKYPSTWKAVNFGLMEAKPADTDTKNVRLSYQPDISKTEIGLSIEESGVVMASQDIKFDKTKTIGTEVAKCGTTADLMTTFCWLTVSRQSKFLTFTISNYQDSEVNKTIDQILSTFKFTN
jgi:hypothetical protein